MRNESRIRVGRKHQAKIPSLLLLGLTRRPSPRGGPSSRYRSPPILLDFNEWLPSYAGDDEFKPLISPALWCNDDSVIPCPLMRLFTSDQKPPKGVSNSLRVPSEPKRTTRMTTRSASSQLQCRYDAIGSYSTRSNSRSLPTAKRPPKRKASQAALLDDDFVVWDNISFETKPNRDCQTQKSANKVAKVRRGGSVMSHIIQSTKSSDVPPPPPPAPSTTHHVTTITPRSIPTPRVLSNTLVSPLPLSPACAAVKMIGWIEPKPTFDLNLLTPPSTPPPPPPPPSSRKRVYKL